MMSLDVPIVLMTPEARAALEAEASSTSLSGDLTGGLLFGHPVREDYRLILSSVRLPPVVGFGKPEFSIDQSRTSEQLQRARSISRSADYVGIWCLHQTPDPDLTDEEWLQAQAVLDDPDFHFKDLVCIVLCYYFGELSLHALYLDVYRSTRSQPLAPAELRSTSDLPQAGPETRSPLLSMPAGRWHLDPKVANRLQFEQSELEQSYQVKAGVSPQDEMIFQLSPKRKYEQMVFYLACGAGFPDKAPRAFILAGNKQQPLSGPELVNWKSQKGLVTVADDLVKWLEWSLEDQVKMAQEWIESEDYEAAAALLKLVLAIDPRTPGAARMLARAQTRAG